MKFWRWIGLVLMLGFILPQLKADDSRIVETSYKYVIPENCTQADAKSIAMDRAILAALANEFKTEVRSQTWSEVRNSNVVSNVDIWRVGSSTVKGQWLETIGEPVFTFHSDGSAIAVEVKMRGRILPFTDSIIDLDISVLRVSDDGIFKTQRFQTGERLELLFTSPVNGSLLVFLGDEEGMVNQLLPFYSQMEPSERIEGYYNYRYFQDNSDDCREQYRLYTDKDLERNILYILFSPSKLIKPVATNVGNIRTLSMKAFREWLNQQYSTDKDLQLRAIPITIIGK